MTWGGQKRKEYKEASPAFAKFVGERVKHHRERRGLTIEQLSFITGLSIKILTLIDKGKAGYRELSLRNMVKVVAALQVTLQCLVPKPMKPKAGAKRNFDIVHHTDGRVRVLIWGTRHRTREFRRARHRKRLRIGHHVFRPEMLMTRSEARKALAQQKQGKSKKKQPKSEEKQEV